jgi:hypothetical protein
VVDVVKDRIVVGERAADVPIGEAKTPTAQTLLQQTVLGLKILNDVELPSVDYTDGNAIEWQRCDSSDHDPFAAEQVNKA